MSILEGLVKAETTLNSNIDMSNKTGDTYNIDTYNYRPTYNQITLPPMDEAALLRILKELTAPAEITQETTDGSVS